MRARPFPSSPRRGGCGINKKTRSHRKAPQTGRFPRKQHASKALEPPRLPGLFWNLMASQAPLLTQEGSFKRATVNSFTPSGWSLTQNVSPDWPPLLPQEGNTFAWTHFHNFGCRVMSLCFRDAPLEHEADGPLI